METIITNINDCSEINVYYQDEIKLETDTSLLYIKSGQKEIENYVENISKPEINNYIENYAKPIVSEVIDNIATPLVDDYLENTAKPTINECANNALAIFNSNAAEKQTIVNNAAQQAVEQATISTSKAAEAANYATEAMNSQILSTNSAASAANSATKAEQILSNINPEQFVKTSGDQTIDGTKTFIAPPFSVACQPSYYLQMSDYDNATTPTALKSAAVTVYDKNKNIAGRMGFWTGADGTKSMRFITFDGKGNNTQLHVGFKSDGSIFTNCPAPKSTSNTSEIATTAWVRNKLFEIDYANPTVKVSNGGTWAANSTYTVPSQGYVSITSRGGTANLKINNTVVGRTVTNAGSGYTSSISNVFLHVGTNDKITTDGDVDQCYFYFWTV